MKKFIFATFLFLISPFLIAKAEAGLGNNNTIERQVKEFRDKVATKVANIKNKQAKKALAGIISETDGAKIIVLKNRFGVETKVELDDILTSYFEVSQGRKAKIKIEDLKIGDYLAIESFFEGDKILANRVFKIKPKFIQGGIVTEVNRDQFFVRLQTVEGFNYIVDIERNTVQKIYDPKKLNFEKSGFSKIREGDTFFVFYESNLFEKKERFSAMMSFIIPQEFLIFAENKK